MNLRPLSFGEVLDGAFSLYRRHFSTFFVTALIPLLPLAGFWLVLGIMLPSTPASMGIVSLVSVLAGPYTLFATILVWATITQQGATAYAGDAPPSWQSGYAASIRRLPTVIGATILMSIAIFVGLLLLFIPGIIATVMFFAAVPVVVLEGRGALEALGRSRELARGAWGRIFAVLFLLIVITSLPSMTLGIASTFSIASVDGETFNSFGFGLAQAASAVGTALTTPLFVLGILLQYYDRRVRAEGLDVELATQQLTPAS